MDQSDSQFSLDIQQALDINSLLIGQLTFHLIDVLASTTHSISSLTLVRRDSFLSSIPKHVPDHIVWDLRSFPIYGPSLFSESSLKALKSLLRSINRSSSRLPLLRESPTSSLHLLKASPLRDKNPRREIPKIGNFRRVLVLFEDPVNSMVESHPEGGARSLNLSLNLNDVLQGVRVALDLSKVPLIPPDPSTLPVGGRLGHFHLNWKFLGALPSVLKTIDLGFTSQWVQSRFLYPGSLLSTAIILLRRRMLFFAKQFQTCCSKEHFRKSGIHHPWLFTGGCFLWQRKQEVGGQ